VQGKGSAGLFGEHSARIWTVLGGMAAVATLVWGAVAAARQSSSGGPGGEGVGTQASSSTASLPTSSAPPLPTPSPTPSAVEQVWVAQLDSVRVDAGPARLREVLAETRRDVPQAQVLNSSDYASLRPGYWVVYYAGSFANGKEVLTYCAAHNRADSDRCVGRFISHDAADIIYICFPSASVSRSHCYRS
jgi:eukaryotic-like serine/threonine-protein kinase